MTEMIGAQTIRICYFLKKSGGQQSQGVFSSAVSSKTQGLSTFCPCLSAC